MDDSATRAAGEAACGGTVRLPRSRARRLSSSCLAGHARRRVRDGGWSPVAGVESRGGQCGAWAMSSRLTVPSPRRSVRPGVSARPGQTPGPSGVPAAPLPGSSPGVPPTRREAAPPAPRAGHWTRDDQIGTLIRVADRQPDLGFMVRLLALCTLPRTDPGTRTQYVRRNGRLRRSGSPSRRPASASGCSTAASVSSPSAPGRRRATPRPPCPAG